MLLYVKWDFENDTVKFGPQGLRGDGDHWYPYVDSGDIENHKTQRRRLVFVEELQMVVGVVEGDPELQWDQMRQDQYAALEDQLDMIFHDIAAGTLDQTGSFYAHRLAVKQANPKPE
jgi:hypothetical protein